MSNTVSAAGTGLPARRRAKTRKRSRSYSVAEAERIALKMPVQRHYHFLEAAASAAQYIPPDPAFWIDQAALAGIRLMVHKGRLITDYPRPATDEQQFLCIWLHFHPGGAGAVADLLIKRAGGGAA